jgi:hypothetical protein
MLNSPDGNQISSWNIPYICEFVPGAESEKAEEYYTAFSKAVEELPYPDESLSIKGRAADSASVGAAIKKAAPHNLLDNSDFRNPVNQRGITGATGHGVYTFDRWAIDSSNGNGYWDVKPNVGCGLNVNGDIWMVFVQRIVGLDRTKPYTIAFQDGYGNIHINESADIQWFDDFAEARIILNTGTMTVVWAALYEGEYTAETLPEYHPKGYGAELVECLRYYRRKNAVVEGANGYASINFDITMRCVPTCAVISTNGGATFYEANADYIAFINLEAPLVAVLYEASADL